MKHPWGQRPDPVAGRHRGLHRAPGPHARHARVGLGAEYPPGCAGSASSRCSSGRAGTSWRRWPGSAGGRASPPRTWAPWCCSPCSSSPWALDWPGATPAASASPGSVECPGTSTCPSPWGPCSCGTPSGSGGPCGPASGPNAALPCDWRVWLWRAWRCGGVSEGANQVLALPGQDRRFTGSYERGSFKGNAFPATSWLNDDPRPVDSEGWSPGGRRPCPESSPDGPPGGGGLPGPADSHAGLHRGMVLHPGVGRAYGSRRSWSGRGSDPTRRA